MCLVMSTAGLQLLCQKTTLPSVADGSRYQRCASSGYAPHECLQGSLLEQQHLSLQLLLFLAR